MSSPWYHRFCRVHLEHPAYPTISPPSLPPSSHYEEFTECEVTIDMLPDVALLRVFDFYLDNPGTRKAETWYTLVHVCRAWRNVVFESPRRLNLRLLCTPKTPVKKLDIWPLFLPIAIYAFPHAHVPLQKFEFDNIIVALKHNDRISQLHLFYLQNSQMEKVFEAMKRPFPELTNLKLLGHEPTEIASESFLGGSAPSLQHLHFQQISFTRLPILLSSATRLVSVTLQRIPHSGHFSPEAIVTSLSVSTKLEYLEITFQYPQSRPDRNSRRPPLPTRALLPVLTTFLFDGVSEYLDDLVAQMDAPLLDEFHIKVIHQRTYDMPQLTLFLSRTPMFKEARLVPSNDTVSVAPRTFDRTLTFSILHGAGCMIDV